MIPRARLAEMLRFIDENDLRDSEEDVLRLCRHAADYIDALRSLANDAARADAEFQNMHDPRLDGHGTDARDIFENYLSNLTEDANRVLGDTE